MDRYLDKTQDGVNLRRETPWISTIRGPASRLESLKTAPKAASKGKLVKKKQESSDSETEKSFSSSDSESSFSESSSDSDHRARKRRSGARSSAPQIRASARLKEAGGRAVYRDKSSSESGESSDYSSSQSSPPRKWQPPKSRAKIPSMAVATKKKPVSESEDASSGDDYSDDEDDRSSFSSDEPMDAETDVEEVADFIVEKILAKRKTDSDSWEYLVKWRGRAYMHCEWVAQKDLSRDLGSDKRSVKLKNFNSKHYNGPTVASFERGYFYNPLFENVEKILAVRRSSSDSPVQFLVKWSGLPYGECTWETRSDLKTQQFESAYAEFKELNSRSRCDSRFKTNSRESYGRVMGRQNDPTVDFSRCLRAVVSTVAPKTQGQTVPMEYEYLPTDKELVVPGEPPFRVFDFQKEGISWLLYNWSQARGSILADEMGLGKTVQTAVTLSQMSLYAKSHGAGELTHLIIAPLSTIEQWRREIKKWTALEPVVYHGNRRDRNVISKYEWESRVDIEKSEKGDLTFETRKSAACMPKFDVLITTFETVSLDADGGGIFSPNSGFVWSNIVIDEAHRLKSAEGKARLSVLAIPCRHRILLTGTPIQNNVSELWTLLHLCAPHVWEDREDFLSEFGDLKSVELTQKLQNKIQPFLLQRRKADVLAHLVPAKEETIVSVELTRLQKQTYRAVYEKNLAVLSAGAESGKKANVPALTNVHMELRKCCNHPFLITGVEERVMKEVGGNQQLMEHLVNSSGKMVFLDKLLGKLAAERSKILIFSQFTMMLDLIEDYLRWRGYLFERLDGAVKSQQRQEAVDRFNRTPSEEAMEEGGTSFVFLLSTKAGGVGLNLTAANYVLLFDHDWNPQNDLQAQARCHRIGQTKEVQIFRLVTRGTYEEKMFQVASQKLGLEQAVMSGSGAKNNGAPKLSKDEMDRLLKEGAYAMLDGDDENEAKFCSENVDEILKNRAKTVSSFVSSGLGGGGFSKARFQVNEEGTEDVDINDPNFWTKMASLSGLEEVKKTDLVEEYLDYSQRKGRAQFGTKPPSSLNSLDSNFEDEYSDDEEEEQGRRGRRPGTGAKSSSGVEEERLKRMKLLLKYVTAFGLTENKDLFDHRFEPETKSLNNSLLEPFSAYEDHLLLIASLYVMAGRSGTSTYDEVHFLPTVRAAVGLLAQYKSTGESPPASIEPLLLDSMFPDLLNAIEQRLHVSIPAFLVPHPLPKFITESVSKKRSAKKILLEIDQMNEIRFHVKTKGLLLKPLTGAEASGLSKEDQVGLLKQLMEIGREKFPQLLLVEKMLPKLTLVRAFQLGLVVGSVGIAPALMERVLQASGFPWVKKFSCAESCLEMLREEGEQVPLIDAFLTPITMVPPAMESVDESSFNKFVLTYLPSDSPLTALDIQDYSRALVYRTVSVLGKKSDKHDAALKQICRSSKTNEFLFTGGEEAGIIRNLTRIEAFKYMWRFQCLHFLRTRLGPEAFTKLEADSAIPSLVAIARGLGLDRWEIVTNVNRHIKASSCLRTVLQFVCKYSLENEAPPVPVMAPPKRKSPDTSSAEDGSGGPSKTVKLTDFFKQPVDIQ
jgi:superfamily II DNA or RNA helicase